MWFGTSQIAGFLNGHTQRAFNCSKLTIVETLEQGDICSKLTIKTPERHQWRHFGIVIDDFEHISHLVLVFLFLFYVSIFEQVIASWDLKNQ